MTIQQPTTPPATTPPPEDVPNRQNPVNFSVDMDAFLAWLSTYYGQNSSNQSWTKSAADITYNNALDAEQSAQEASDSASSAISAGNVLGNWSSLTGSASVGDGVFHDDGVWRARVAIADITTSEPATSNSDWQLMFKRAVDLDIESATQYTNPDSLQLNQFVQREWSDLTLPKTYNASCFYRGLEYDINNPVDDVTIAPPPLAGRTYYYFNGVDDVIDLDLDIQSGQTLTYWFLSPNSKVNQVLSDGVLVELDSDGTYNFNSGFTAKVDGETVTTSSKYPQDGLFHKIELTFTSNLTLTNLASSSTSDRFYSGSLSSIYLYNDQSELIHSYELRNDAVDTLSGNLIKDPEFTWKGNWDLIGGVNISNNAANFTASAQNTSVTTNVAVTANETYRISFDYTITSGDVSFTFAGGGTDILSGTDTYDKILIANADATSVQISDGNGNALGSVKNFRVIKMNELSPSADFSSDVGFTLSSGVTIDTIAKQAVFDGSASNSISFAKALKSGDKVRVVGSAANVTTGTLNVSFAGANSAAITISGGKFDQQVTLTAAATAIEINTADGFDGNLKTSSYTLNTDGTESGSITKGFEKHWKLKSGEDLLPQHAGTVKFGSPAILSAGTYEIEPMPNAGEGSSLVLSRSGTDEPVVSLSTSDIALGYQITHPNTQPDTSVIINTNDAYRLVKRGFNLELVRG